MSQPKRIILSFDTRNVFSATAKEKDTVKITFVYSLNEELDQRMGEGFKAYEASHGIDVNYKRFSVVLYNKKGIACGVINAYTAFAEIYIDDTWVVDSVLDVGWFDGFYCHNPYVPKWNLCYFLSVH